MANPEHLAILKQGVEQWNKWREENQVSQPVLSDADLTNFDLCGANLDRADLTGVDFRRGTLKRATLNEANLERANLQGVSLRGAFLRKTVLREANLHAAHLNGVHLGMLDFRGADLSSAGLRNAHLRGANLRGANLTRAVLKGANLRGANLGAAALCGANLTGANILNAELRGADFSEAIVGATNFSNVNLSEAKGLDSVHHGGPSTVGIDTLYRSAGKISDIFLRGCGVPDEFIAYIGSMVGRPIEFYSCFISYSTKDQEFAERLHADLQAKGVRCWFAPEEMKAGRKLHEQIDEAIRLNDKLLLILSEHSMNSEWVKTEIATARKREVQEERQMLFPVALVPYDPVVKEWECFDADRGKDSAREIREYFIPDFSNWKDHDSYQAAFQRLVKDLKAEASK